MTHRHAGESAASSVPDQFVVGAPAVCALVGVSLLGVVGGLLGSLI